MSELIKVLHLLKEDNSTIFSDGDIYSVPLYQRAYAWEEKEILQLIHDIYYMEDLEEAHYYLGSLIVDKNSETYEVIDGQQRLTTLFILVKCLYEIGALTESIPDTLRFSCRDKSNYTLKNLHRLIDEDRIEESIRAGKDIVMAGLRTLDMPSFLAKMKRVVLYRVEVPAKTDLNRYFEIMNTRGEQLEQHDILKAALMNCLTDGDEKAGFAAIWDACSDMTGYVQMHFSVKAREALFGREWRNVPEYTSLVSVSRDKADGRKTKITEIIQDAYHTEHFDGVDDNSDRIRFESIIEFPYFLLHVLKVFVANYNVTSNEDGLVAELLDDKKLTRAFERVIENGVMNGKAISMQKEEFARGFIKCLLLCRFLFDKYIIKREFVNEDSDGKWSMKELHVSGQQSKKKAYYRNTWVARSGEWENTREGRTKRNVMLQSCFRVSYTSPKIMHWITELLIWLTKDNLAMLHHLDEYETVSEEIAKRAVRRDFLEKCKEGEKTTYNMGVDTPHIVFNYLDYLLWKETEPDFVFEFRNSVEHWYPQHPSEGTFEQWSHDDGVDNFGNLCIIQRSVNSKFSNMSPDAKKSTFDEMIKKGSLKLRIMASLTQATDNKSASYNWRDNVYLQHEQEMISKLMKACY